MLARDFFEAGKKWEQEDDICTEARQGETTKWHKAKGKQKDKLIPGTVLSITLDKFERKLRSSVGEFKLLEKI